MNSIVDFCCSTSMKFFNDTQVLLHPSTKHQNILWQNEQNSHLLNIQIILINEIDEKLTSLFALS